MLSASLIRPNLEDPERQQMPIAELRNKSLDDIADVLSQTPEGILKNNGLILEDGTLTVAALILMGKYPQRWLPAFTARCVSLWVIALVAQSSVIRVEMTLMAMPYTCTTISFHSRPGICEKDKWKRDSTVRASWRFRLPVCQRLSRMASYTGRM